MTESVLLKKKNKMFKAYMLRTVGTLTWENHLDHFLKTKTSDTIKFFFSFQTLLSLLQLAKKQVHKFPCENKTK